MTECGFFNPDGAVVVAAGRGRPEIRRWQVVCPDHDWRGPIEASFGAAGGTLNRHLDNRESQSP